jgi:hypothetical protein
MHVCDHIQAIKVLRARVYERERERVMAEQASERSRQVTSYDFIDVCSRNHGHLYMLYSTLVNALLMRIKRWQRSPLPTHPLLTHTG